MMGETLGFGYDEGYRRCPNLWGLAPARQVVEACARFASPVEALDIGCGEGKNTAYVARLGHHVLAVDGSLAALRNANELFGAVAGVRWVHSEALAFLRSCPRQFQLIICTGVVHCMPDDQSAEHLVALLAERLCGGGHLVLSSFNDRRQDLFGHEPGFRPLLRSHAELLQSLVRGGFAICSSSDTDLQDLHPHIGIAHVHSITRVLATRSDPSTEN